MGEAIMSSETRTLILALQAVRRGLDEALVILGAQENAPTQPEKLRSFLVSLAAQSCSVDHDELLRLMRVAGLDTRGLGALQRHGWVETPSPRMYSASGKTRELVQA
jgi:hypothetical protein